MSLYNPFCFVYMNGYMLTLNKNNKFYDKNYNKLI